MNSGMPASFILYAHNVVECQMMLGREIEGKEEEEEKKKKKKKRG